MHRITLIVLSLFVLPGCAMWPYKSDFNCPIPKAHQCKSLYEINKLTDEGIFEPEAEQHLTCKSD